LKLLNGRYNELTIQILLLDSEDSLPYLLETSKNVMMIAIRRCVKMPLVCNYIRYLDL